MEMARRDTHSLFWNTLKKDPTKMAVLRALVSCLVRLRHNRVFGWDISDALAQRYVCLYLSIFIGRGGSALLNSFQVPFDLHATFTSLSRYPDFWSSPVGNVTEENQ